MHGAAPSLPLRGDRRLRRERRFRYRDISLRPPVRERMATAQRTPQAYPQIDRVLWCSLPEAYERILPEQPPLLDKAAESSRRLGLSREGRFHRFGSRRGLGIAPPRNTISRSRLRNPLTCIQIEMRGSLSSSPARSPERLASAVRRCWRNQAFQRARDERDMAHSRR